MGRRRNLTTGALAEVARRQGIRHKQERVREAWDRGLYAVHSAGYGRMVTMERKRTLVFTLGPPPLTPPSSF